MDRNAEIREEMTIIRHTLDVEPLGYGRGSGKRGRAGIPGANLLGLRALLTRRMYATLC